VLKIDNFAQEFLNFLRPLTFFCNQAGGRFSRHR
jgi:hypothetical protein